MQLAEEEEWVCMQGTEQVLVKQPLLDLAMCGDPACTGQLNMHQAQGQTGKCLTLHVLQPSHIPATWHHKAYYPVLLGCS